MSHSRANLNKSYFTNRQDRYIHFATQPSLAQYCFDFLQTISSFSYQLSTKPGIGPHSYQRENYFLDWPDPQTHPHEIHVKAQEALAAFQTSKRTTHGIQLSAEEGLVSTSNDVLLFPVIQAGQFDIREEESALSLLFHGLHASEAKLAEQRWPLVDLTSGYFGLYKMYQNFVLANNVATRIVAASPEVCDSPLLTTSNTNRSISSG